MVASWIWDSQDEHPRNYWACFRKGSRGRLLADIRRNYGMMLDQGATSCWETFPGFEKGRLTPGPNVILE